MFLIISDDELAGLEQAAVSLTEDIKLGKDFAREIEETVQKGLVWKRLIDDARTAKTPLKENGRKLKRRKAAAITEEITPLPTALIKVPQYKMCAEGFQGWLSRTRAPLKRWLLKSGTSQDGGEEITSEIFDSETCRGGQSLRKSNYLNTVPFLLYFSGFILMYLYLLIRF